MAGYSPITLSDLIPGEHYFSIEHDGYKTWSGVLPVEPSGMETKEVFLVEGKRIRWERLRRRMSEAGIGNVRTEDASALQKYLKADWLLLVSISHLGGRSLLQPGIFESGGTEVSPLGIFPADEREVGRVAGQVERWIQGDRSIIAATTVDPERPPGKSSYPHEDDPFYDPSRVVENGDGPWYHKWWFWTAVGVVAAGAAAGTAVWLSRDSGIQVEIYR
jgi:hypothetical protein